jgi:ferredoxin-NADP reductase
MAIPEYQFKLNSCEWITSNVKQFSGKIISETDWKFIPGQFITISFEHEGKILKRSYSIANPPQENKIEFAASFVEGGPGSAYLFSRVPGDTLTVSGPFGRLILKSELNFKRLILIATSTGITPYRSMLPTIQLALRTNPLLKVEIIQGVQTRDQVLFAEDFKNFCKAHPSQASFSIALSREKQLLAEEFCATFLGRVQHILEQMNLNPEEDLIYLCGNPQMIDETTELLKNKEFNIQQIIREKYISR